MAVKRDEYPPRHELKYFINRGELEALRARIEPVLQKDRHCIDKPYAIRSLYFDDAYNSAWYDKQDGVQDRDKYRIRIYNMSDDVIFLERKRKMGDLIQKSSARITRRLAERMIEGDPRGMQKAANPLVQDMYVMMRTKLLRPAVIVDYERDAYVMNAQNVRITFDMRLRTGLSSFDIFNPDLPTVNPHDRDLEILEVKFDSYLPDYIRGLLTGIAADRSAISKYILCRRFEPLG